MSNSGRGAFLGQDLHVPVPIYWLLSAIGHLENGDKEAQATAEQLSDYLPRVPAAYAGEKSEGRDGDGVEEVKPER